MFIISVGKANHVLFSFVLLMRNISTALISTKNIFVLFVLFILIRPKNASSFSTLASQPSSSRLCLILFKTYEAKFVFTFTI